MTQKKPKHREPCVYCRRPARTREHVPPRGFFPSNPPSNLITVPCCADCNRLFQTDQEYTQLVFLARPEMDGHPDAAELIAKAKRGFEHHRAGGPASSVVASVRALFVHTPSGTVETGAFVPELDRIERVCARVTRGLFFAVNGMILPPEYAVRAHFIGGEREKTDVRTIFESAIALIKRGEGREFGNCFEYKFIIFDDDPNCSAWLLTFYNHNHAVCVTSPVSEFHPGAPRY